MRPGPVEDKDKLKLAAELRQGEVLVALEEVDWERARGRLSDPAELVLFSGRAKRLREPVSELPAEVQEIYQELSRLRLDAIPAEEAGRFSVSPVGGRVLLLMPEYQRDAMKELLSSFIPGSCFVCSSNLSEALQRENISLIVNLDPALSKRKLREVLSAEDLQIPLEMLSADDSCVGDPVSMLRALELVQTYSVLKALSSAGHGEEGARYPEVGVYGTTAGHFLRKGPGLQIVNPLETLSAIQNRGDPFSHFAELDFPSSRDALALLFGTGAQTASDPWAVRPGFARRYGPEDFQDLIVRPGATLLSLVSSGQMLGYLLGYTEEQFFPQRGQVLLEALKQCGKAPQGKTGYLKLIEITPLGKMFAQLHGMSLNDELFSVMMVLGQAKGIDQFIFECREFPFPNQGAISSHIGHGAVHTGISLASSGIMPEGAPRVTVAGVFYMGPGQGLDAVIRRDHSKIAREDRVKARLDRMKFRFAAKERGVFFIPAEDASLGSRTLAQLKEEPTLKGLSRKDFVSLVRQLQDIHFQPSERDMPVSSAECYADSGVLSVDLLLGLKKGKSLLSLGSGSSHMARFLVRACGVDARQIVLSDTESHMRTRRQGFEFISAENLAESGRCFDYIVLEKPLRELRTANEPTRSYRFFEDLDKVEAAFLDGNLFSLGKREKEFFCALVEADVPFAAGALQKMKNALALLNPGGEMRLAYSGLLPQVEAYLMLKLKESYPELQYIYDQRRGCLCCRL